MTGSPLDGLGTAILQGIIKSITGRAKCDLCKKCHKVKEMEEDFLGRLYCKECMIQKGK